MELQGRVKVEHFFREDGFTLLEMVIAMGLFAVGLLGLALMSSGLVTSDLMAHQRTVATQLAKNKMEILGKSDYSMVSGSEEKKLDASEISGGGVFERKVTVEEKTEPPRKEVTVKVSWELKGVHRVVVKTILTP